MNYPFHCREQVPDGLLDVTNWDENEGAFVTPSEKRLSDKRLRIVVCTCLMAAKVKTPPSPPLPIIISFHLLAL